MKEHLREGQSHRWRMTYRLLCKTSPAIPEIALDFASLPLMKRSFQVDDVYAPVPKDDNLDENDSKFYAHVRVCSKLLSGFVGVAPASAAVADVSAAFPSFASIPANSQLLPHPSNCTCSCTTVFHHFSMRAVDW